MPHFFGDQQVLVRGRGLRSTGRGPLASYAAARGLRVVGMTSNRTELSERSFIDLHSSWLDPTEAHDWFTRLETSVAWETREIVLFGRRVLHPRLVGWGGGLPYRYSGQTLPPRALPQGVDALIERVSGAVGARFNHVLFNFYRDGSDSMGFHADDEPELGERPLVASLSVGGPRRFVVKRGRGSGAVRVQPLRVEFELDSGSLLFMGGSCQREFVHAVPKTRRLVAPRINLTFRFVQRAP
jgi:alkylated DNA repair dioxygenase AlkB